MAKKQGIKPEEVVIDRLIELIEKDQILPWQKPWKFWGMINLDTYDEYAKKGEAPEDIFREHGYRGVNRLMLNMLMPETPYFLTFNQITKRGGKVIPGQHGFPIIYWNMAPHDTKDKDANGDPIKKDIPFMRYFTVFNLSQTEGIEVPAYLPTKPADSDEAIEALMKAPWNPKIKFAAGDTAAYSPAKDIIILPKRGQFQTTAEMYWVWAHEAGHGSGAKDRLNRDTLVKAAGFDIEAYSQEELVACLTQAEFCGQHGIYTERMLQLDAAYLKSWLGVLKANPKLLFKANTQAKRALVWIEGGAEKNADLLNGNGEEAK